MEENTDSSSRELPGRPDDPKGKIPEGMKIVGYNMLVLLIYSVVCKIGSRDLGALFMDAFLVGAHVLVCIIVAAGKRSWMWLLSALLVLIIGFSTCVSIPGIGS